MALTDAQDELFRVLRDDVDSSRAACGKLDAYYEGEQRLDQLGLAVPPDLRRFVTIINWPRMGVDAVEERLDVEGFRLPGQESADEALWRIWQANDLDEESQLAHLDALIYGRAYVCVGANEEDADTPLVTVESPLEMAVRCDPRTRRVVAGISRYALGDQPESGEAATLYLPDVTIWLETSSRTGSGWAEVDRDEHGLGLPPIVPLRNRPRGGLRSGLTEMKDLIPLTDAAARALTNLQIAQETHAVPQRYVLGATKGDFVDADGNPLTAWEAYFGTVWAMQNQEAKAGQFPASDLRNFHETVKHYAMLASGMSGLPPSAFGIATDNPASADAIRAAEARLIKKCERRQRTWSGSWEQVIRFVERIRTGRWDDDLKRLETLWRDPATPTIAQKADATVKLVTAGVLPVEAAWEELGYRAGRRETLRAMRAREASDPTLERIARELATPMPGGSGDDTAG